MLTGRRFNQEEVEHCQQGQAKRARTIGRIDKGAAVLAVQHVPQLVDEVRQAGVQRACMAPRNIRKSPCSNHKQRPPAHRRRARVRHCSAREYEVPRMMQAGASLLTKYAGCKEPIAAQKPNPRSTNGNTHPQLVDLGQVGVNSSSWGLDCAARTNKEVCVRQQLNVGHQVVGRRAAAAHRRLVEVVLQVAAGAVERPGGEQPAAYGPARERARLRHQRMVIAHHHARATLPCTRHIW